MASKRAREIDLHDLLTSPLSSLTRLPGSGDEQAPKLVELLCRAGLRALHQQSPPGIAVYVHPECELDLASIPCEHAHLWLMCGLGPMQAILETTYMRTVRQPLLAKRLATRLRELRPNASLDAALAPLETWSARTEAENADIGQPDERREVATAQEEEERLEAAVRFVVASAATAMDVSELQIEREWQLLLSTHSSLANACLVRVLAATRVHLQDATLILNAERGRVRLSVLLYDAIVHEQQQRPRAFVWIPALCNLLAEPDATALATTMCARLWRDLRTTQGYYAPQQLTSALDPRLVAWFGSCLQTHGGLALRGTLAPKQQLCLYMHGAAGSG